MLCGFRRVSALAYLVQACFASAAPFELDIIELKEISPRPGTRITSQNFEQFDHLIDKDIGLFVDKGLLSLTVGEPTSFRPHPAFIMA
ncbi:uncharacterized protein METZ01_LOCUS500719, partial [marine metagenome]